MSAPTMRELCAKAPQGQWKANCGTVSVDSPNAARRERVCAVCSPAGAAPEAWEGIGNRRHATAQFIARLSPEVIEVIMTTLEQVRDTSIAMRDATGTLPKKGESVLFWEAPERLRAASCHALRLLNCTEAAP